MRLSTRHGLYLHHALVMAGALGFLLLLGLLFGAIGAFVPHQDVSWFITVARSMNEGAELYSGFRDPNPPVIFYLSLLAVKTAEIAGGHDLKIYLYGVTLLAAAVSLWVAQVLARALAGRNRLFFVAYAGLILLVTAVIIGTSNGQRSQLALVLLLPHVVFGALSAAGQGASVPARGLAALLAGLAVTIKPHYAVVFAVVELCQLARTRDLKAFLRWENWLAAGACLAILVVLHRDVAAYIELQAPRNLADYTRYLPRDFFILALPGVQLSFAVALASLISCLAYLRWGGGGKAERSVIAQLLALAAGFVLIFFLQWRGYDYHAFGFRAAALLALGLPVALWIARLLSPAPPARREEAAEGGARPAAVLAAISLVALVCLWQVSFSPVRLMAIGIKEGRYVFFGSEVQPVVAAARARFGDRPITMASLAFDFRPSFPAASEIDARWVQPDPFLWTLWVLYKDFEPAPGRPFRSLAEMGQEERRLFDEQLSVLIARRPDLLIIERPVETPWGLPQMTFDFIAYFSQDPRFEALLHGYERKVEGAYSWAYLKKAP